VPFYRGEKKLKKKRNIYRGVDNFELWSDTLFESFLICTTIQDGDISFGSCYLNLCAIVKSMV